MQLERSYFRRVNVLKSYIYEQGLNARRAYFSIRLAVKTSRPHYLVYFFVKNGQNCSLQIYSFIPYFQLSDVIPFHCIIEKDNHQIIQIIFERYKCFG